MIGMLELSSTRGGCLTRPCTFLRNSCSVRPAFALPHDCRPALPRRRSCLCTSLQTQTRIDGTSADASLASVSRGGRGYAAHLSKQNCAKVDAHKGTTRADLQAWQSWRYRTIQGSAWVPPKTTRPCRACLSTRRHRPAASPLRVIFGHCARRRCGFVPAQAGALCRRCRARSPRPGIPARKRRNRCILPDWIIEHILADVEAVHRAHFDAIHVFALDAVFGDHVGHTRYSRLGVRRGYGRTFAGVRKHACRWDPAHLAPWRSLPAVTRLGMSQHRNGAATRCRSYNARAASAPPRRSVRATTRITRTVPARNGSVSTSPGRTLACGLSVGWRLMRTRPPFAIKAANRRCVDLA